LNGAELSNKVGKSVDFEGIVEGNADGKGALNVP